MINRMSRRAALAFAGLALALAGCQTMPKSSYSSEQIEALEQAGFAQDGSNYLLGLDNKVLFAFNSSELQDDKRQSLNELGRTLADVGIRSAGVEGHASVEGDADYNLKLSQERAEVVMSALVGGGLNRMAMRVRGLGALDPVAPNDSEEGRQQNRRVVIIVTPVDAMPL